MTLVEQDKRVDALREWGVSEPLIRLSQGQPLHECFRESALGPPWYVYQKDSAAPEGPPFAVLWERRDEVTGVRKVAEGVEFIRYGVGYPDEIEVLARTEQGFWFVVFGFLFESGVPIDDLRVAALAARFKYLDRMLEDYSNPDPRCATYEGFLEWQHELVLKIDFAES